MCKAYAVLALIAFAPACDKTAGLFASKSQDAGAAPVVELPRDARARLDVVMKEVLDAELAYSPTLATWLGAHAYDDRLDDVRLDAQGREVVRLKTLRDRVRAIDPKDLDPVRRFDRELLL